MDTAPRARELLFDYLTVAERGSRTDAAAAARAAFGPSATGTAPVVGTGERREAADAAFVNGIAAHSIELDDTYEPASLHPGVVVWPAVLAVAAERAATLGDALAAAAAGYDAVCGLGDRTDPAETYRRGFHPTGVCGPIGAAVAVARLLELDGERERHAVGIAASMAAGLLEFLADGAWTKPLHAGNATAAGIRAARLAAAGYTAPASAIEGRLGFLHAFGGRAGAAPADGDGTPPTSDEPAIGRGLRGTAVKHYPCCRYMHGCIDLLLDLAVEEELDPADVEGIRCGVLSAGWSLVAEPPPAAQAVRNQVDAQFSMAFGAALALARRSATLDDFERAAELAQELAPLMLRVECFRSARLDAAYPAAWGAEVEVRTRSGTVLRRAEDHFRGSPRRPAGRTELAAKAAGLVGAERAAALERACFDSSASVPVDHVSAPGQ
ncbi:MAG TPA: MmgE/PrpD family protein [Solirubrobacter sp.]|nr:MmgE/PrpD family protein [Solirubrobacter sp.]